MIWKKREPGRPNRRSLLVRGAVAAGLGTSSLLLSFNSRAFADSSPPMPSLGGWNISADGNVVDIVYDNQTGLAGVHPFTEADFPEANSQFESGPFGSSLASILWPGSAGGNFGSLSGELGLPSQLAPVTSQLNDPVKANAQYPAGPATATYPAGSSNSAVEMNATADSTGTTATSALFDQSTQNVFSFSTAKGTSSASATSTAVASASSDLGGISILGGLIKIGGVDSTATATSDGNTASGKASTDVAGVTVMGQQASIGSNGLVLPDLTAALPPLVSNVAGPVIQNALSQEIQALGITVKELPSTETTNAASETITSGGVQIVIDPPPALATTLEQATQLLAPYFPPQAAIIPTLPGILQGGNLTITIGRATASSAASPPFDESFTPPPIPGGGSTGGSTATGATSSQVPTGPTGGIAPSGTGSLTGTGAGGGGASLAPTPSGSSGASTPGSTPGATSVTPISLSKPLGTGPVVLAILGALVLAYGLWCVARMLVPRDLGPACPLGADAR